MAVPVDVFAKIFLCMGALNFAFYRLKFIDYCPGQQL